MSEILLGFDFGQRRTGVAVGQTLTGTARALITLHSRDGAPDWSAITTLINEWQPNALVVGIPCHMDGTEQEMTHAARRFGNRLAGRYNLPVHRVDERLTSADAEAELADTGKRYTKEDVDKLAAQYILQAWLDQHTTNNK